MTRLELMIGKKILELTLYRSPDELGEAVWNASLDRFLEPGELVLRIVADHLRRTGYLRRDVRAGDHREPARRPTP